MDTFSPDLHRFYNPDLLIRFLFRLPKFLNNLPDNIILTHSPLESLKNKSV